MTDDTFSPPFGGDSEDERPLPDHEYDENESVGGGVLGAGGTATDRGTGTLEGQAQGDDPGGEEDAVGLPEGVVAGMPAGGAQTYVPAFTEDADADGDGDALPDA